MFFFTVRSFFLILYIIMIDNFLLCKRCGKLFRKFNRQICDACFKKEGQALASLRTFYEKNPGAKYEDAVKTLNIEPSIAEKLRTTGQIGKIGVEMTYPCQICKKPISEGRFCQNCIGEFNTVIVDLKDRLENVPKISKYPHKKPPQQIVQPRKIHFGDSEREGAFRVPPADETDKKKPGDSIPGKKK
ncbi:hypothetical protein ACFL35_09370 [Candidatus Riflebacteria bacterium]